MEVLPHHVKHDVCRTRPAYREGKVPKTVKVYTCAQESKFLIATNLPSIGVHNELVKLFSIYGQVDEHKMLDEYPCETFCETILIKFNKIENARTAKIKLDNYNFYGNCLHVFYAPEYESIDDVREKLDERRKIVAFKCQKYDAMKFGTLEYDLMQKKEPYKRVGFSKKKAKPKNSAVDKSNKNTDQKAAIFPELPAGWVRPSTTGNLSYDETANQISSQLKKTIPHQQDVNVYPKKRKKVLRV